MRSTSPIYAHLSCLGSYPVDLGKQMVQYETDSTRTAGENACSKVPYACLKMSAIEVNKSTSATHIYFKIG